MVLFEKLVLAKETEAAGRTFTKPGMRIKIPLSIQKSLAITAVPAKMGVWHKMLNLPGTIIPVPGDVHDLFSPVIGIALSSHIPTVGQRVRKGRVLAVIRQTLTSPELLGDNLKALSFEEGKVAAFEALEKNKTSLQLRKEQLKRSQALYQAGVIALKDLELKEAEEKDALSAYQAAQYQVYLYKHFSLRKKNNLTYRDFSIVSPISGVVEKADLTPGELVNPTKILFVLVNLSRVWVKVHVYENEIGRVHKGDLAFIRSLSYPGKEFKGRVEIIAPALNPKNRTLPVFIQLYNPGWVLKSQMLASVNVWDSGGKGILIPSSCVLKRHGKTYLFIKKRDEFYRQRAVIQKASGGVVRVTEGIKPGDDVVARGIYILESQYEHEKQSHHEP
jgi:cobalt-zinc-cadmium efflux system membrane fusion protein